MCCRHLSVTEPTKPKTNLPKGRYVIPRRVTTTTTTITPPPPPPPRAARQSVSPRPRQPKPRPQRPPIQRVISGGTSIVHHELIKAVNGATSGLQINDVINPRNTAIFPWLSTVAAAFDMWYPVSMAIEYQPRSGTLINGRYAMALDYDVTDDDSSLTFTQVMAMRGAVSGPVYSPGTLVFRPAETVMQQHKYFCGMDSPTDRLNHPVRVLVMVDATTEGPLGDIYIRYTINLFNPEPVFALSTNQLTARVGLNGNSNSPLGDFNRLLVNTAARGLDHQVLTQNQLTEILQNIGQFKGLSSQLVGALNPVSNSLYKKKLAMPDLEDTVIYIMPPFSGVVHVRIHMLCILPVRTDPLAAFSGLLWASNYPCKHVGGKGYTYTNGSSATITYLRHDPTTFATQDMINSGDYATDYYYTDWEADFTTGPENEPFLFVFWYENMNINHVQGESYINCTQAAAALTSFASPDLTMPLDARPTSCVSTKPIVRKC